VHENYMRTLELENQLEIQIADMSDFLAEAEQAELHRYLQCLRNIVAGDNRWERASGRYR
jgi:hypothetical protein